MLMARGELSFRIRPVSESCAMGLRYALEIPSAMVKG